jgi:archaellum biogenesis ATPase FlaH
MDMGGSIEIIQGSIGSGKSAVCMQLACNHLLSGGVVASNFSWVPDWSWVASQRSISCKIGLRDRFVYSESLRERNFLIGSIESIDSVSGRRGEKMRSLCVGTVKKKIDKMAKPEGYGLLIIDEAHMFFNSRTFSKNQDYVSYFSQLRKNGWKTLLVAHDIEMIDKQIRFFIELQSRFRNLKKVKIPFTPFPLCPIPAFLIVRKYCGAGPGGGMKHSVDFQFLDKFSSNMYDSLEIFADTEIKTTASKQGLPVHEIKEALLYYRKRNGFPYGKKPYCHNIKGPYSLVTNRLCFDRSI